MTSHPTADSTQRIRVRAYELWQLAGEPKGLSEEFWEQAKEQIAAEDERPQVFDRPYRTT